MLREERRQQMEQDGWISVYCSPVTEVFYNESESLYCHWATMMQFHKEEEEYGIVIYVDNSIDAFAIERRLLGRALSFLSNLLPVEELGFKRVDYDREVRLKL